jgi:hypothetical protein
MIDLAFAVEGITIERFAVAPTLLFKLRISGTPDVQVDNILLQCQFRLDVTQRRYTPPEQEQLVELFGETQRWDDSLRSMLWTHASLQVPGFVGERVIDLPVPCSFDFNVAATKFFYGLEGGEVPLALLFSGTVFYRDEEGFLQMDQIAWSKETACRLPVSLWQEMIEVYYPGSVWLRIERPAFDALYRYKRERGLTSFDETLRVLLEEQREESRP